MLYLYVLVVVVCVVFLVFFGHFDGGTYVCLMRRPVLVWLGTGRIGFSFPWFDPKFDLPIEEFGGNHTIRTLTMFESSKLVVTIQQSREPNTPTVVVISTSASLQWVTIPQNFPNISPTFPRQMRTSSCTPCACGSQRRRKRSEMVSPGTKWEVIYRLFFMGNDRKTSMPHGKR